MVLLIMSKDTDEGAMNQVDGIIEKIDHQDQSGANLPSKSAGQARIQQSSTGNKNSRGGPLVTSVFSKLKEKGESKNTKTARIMKAVPTVKMQVRSKLQKAFADAQSAKFLDQLYQNHAIRESKPKDSEVFQKAPDAKDED